MKLFRYLLFIVIIGSIRQANAQLITIYAEKFHWGLKGGFNFSRFSNNVFPFDNQNKSDQYYAGFSQYARMTFVPGVTAEYQWTNHFGIGVELNYNGRGSVYRSYIDGSDYIDDYGTRHKGYNYFKYRINNLELPLLLQWKPTNFNPGKLGIVLYGGAAPYWNVRAKYAETTDKTSDVYSAFSSLPNNNLSDVRKFNISTVGGIKLLTSEQEHNNFYIDFRFQYDMKPTFKVDYIGDYNVHNMGTYNWSAGVYFGVSF
ncbi:porin family protein [Rhizosphaericola mali]|uniref:PorT family protein n=1 Tax=Rhizosphaericola mali TaxID=2545455 RepID=A0A5P2FWL5_9BACT|nr:porin family protein [Rhizosphaericola mali]QES87297.1 PorT family protein [Rhizosphaericola mali]